MKKHEPYIEQKVIVEMLNQEKVSELETFLQKYSNYNTLDLNCCKLSTTDLTTLGIVPV